MNVTIKPLTINSLDNVSKLDTRFKSHWSRKLYKDRMISFPGLSHGAYKDDRLIGFILGKRLAPRSVFVSRIVVSKMYEGKGIAKSLLKQFEKKSKGKRIESLIRSGNKRSYFLHKKSGYGVDPKFKYEYKNKETGIRFFKDL